MNDDKELKAWRESQGQPIDAEPRSPFNTGHSAPENQNALREAAFATDEATMRLPEAPAVPGEAAAPSEGAVAWREFDHETIDYVLKYGGRCRECADHLGLCPNGLPCDVNDAKTAIRWVLKALNYGISNGYLSNVASPAVATIAVSVKLAKDGEPVTLAECPVGLFESYSGELCLKTEYGNNEGRIDAYIVSTGEFFWGAAPQTIASQRAQLVQPVLSSIIPATKGGEDALRRAWEYGRTSWCPAGILTDKERTESEWREALAALSTQEGMSAQDEEAENARLVKERDEADKSDMSARDMLNDLEAERDALRAALEVYEDALAEAEAIFGGEYADNYGPMFELALKARAARALSDKAPTAQREPQDRLK